MPSQANPLQAARLLLRTSFAGVLRVADRSSPTKFIRDAERVCLVAPVEKWMLDEESGTLFVSEERDDSVQLHVEFRQLNPNTDGVCDRWLAYHQSTSHRSWCAMEILGARLGMDVLEPEHLISKNEFQTVEAKLCRRANADRAKLQWACEQMWRRELPEALCVGIDQQGLDIRTRIGMVRLDLSYSKGVSVKLDGDTELIPTNGPDVLDAIDAMTRPVL